MLQPVDARNTPGLVPGAGHDGKKAGVAPPLLVMPGLVPGTHERRGETRRAGGKTRPPSGLR